MKQKIEQVYKTIDGLKNDLVKEFTVCEEARKSAMLTADINRLRRINQSLAEIINRKDGKEVEKK